MVVADLTKETVLGQKHANRTLNGLGVGRTVESADGRYLGESHPFVTGREIHEMSENQLSAWRGKHVGIVFQFFQMLPALSLLQNIILPMDFANKYSRRERRERAMHLLEIVGLADQAHKLPSMVSGGQQQRAAIARALANDPDLLVADEPTGNLDTRSANTIFDLFSDLVEQGKTLIMVTHDKELARRVPRVVEITDGKITRDEFVGGVVWTGY